MNPDDRARPGASLSPLSARAALDAYFLEARSKLLDLAAILDRIDRGADPAAVDQDPRLVQIRQALEMLPGPRNGEQAGGRAESVQLIFSLDYDPGWERPQPR
jgi:hypothetical protein